MALLAWIVLPVMGVATTVTGSIDAAGYPERTMVRAGYVGSTDGRESIFNHAGFTMGPGSRSARCDSFQPRATEIRSDGSGRFLFVHRGLPMGRYVFYAHVGESRLAWKVVRVGSGGTARVDLRLARSDRGALRAVARSVEPSQVWLQPCQSDGKPLLPGLTLDAWHLEQDTIKGQALFEDLTPGWYRVALVGVRTAHRTDDASLSVLEMKGSWLARVERGKTLSLQLPPQ